MKPVVFLQPQYLKLLKASYLLLWHSPSWFSFYHLFFLSPPHPLNTPSRPRAQYMSVIILCLWASNSPFHIPTADAWTWAGLSNSFGFAGRSLLSLPIGGGGGSAQRRRRQKPLPTWSVSNSDLSQFPRRPWFQLVAIPTAPDKQQPLLRGLGRPHEVLPSNFMF